MDYALAEAFIHGKHNSCGFTLAPFTLRHAFVLDAIESPLALGSDAKIEYEDLFKAARICSTWNEDQMRVILESSAGVDEVDQLSAQLERERDNAVDHYQAWNAWLYDYITCPRLLESPGAGRYECNPILVTVAKLVKHGFNVNDAWWTPFSAARWYSLAFDDLNPDAKFTLMSETLADKLRSLGRKV